MSRTVQYGRKLSIVIADRSGKGIDFAQFRVTFEVRRGDVQTPNTADVRIYNLSENTANQIASKEFSSIVIQAGYEDNFGLIFKGTIKQRRKGREDARNTYVDITAADGDEAYNFSTMSISLAAGATPDDSVQAFLRSMVQEGIAEGYLPDFSTNGLPRGRVFYGMTRDELRDFGKANNVLWSFQDGKLTMVPTTSYVPGTIPVISPSTGLIGVPEQTQSGIDVTVLLNPYLRIGKLIKLDATVNSLSYGVGLTSNRDNDFLEASVKPNANGLYYVMQADHSGDTRGNNWYTRLTCLPVDATAVPFGEVEKATVFPADAVQDY